MDDNPMYDIGTGKHMPDLDGEICNLIFCIGESKIPVLEFEPSCIMGAEVHFVSSIDEALRTYYSEVSPHRTGMPYSHFFALHDNTCDVYIPGNHFLRHYNMDYTDDWDNVDPVMIDFWLFRARYHRRMLEDVMDIYLLQQPAECFDIVESSHIDIHGAQTIDTLLGHPIIGKSSWVCGTSCNDCNPTAPPKRHSKNYRPPGSPKRPLSSYMFFANENRDKIRSEHPDETFGAIGRILGNQWRVMNDQERATYDEMAHNDRMRYEVEKEIYSRDLPE